jgi:hypothetical protein
MDDTPKLRTPAAPTRRLAWLTPGLAGALTAVLALLGSAAATASTQVASAPPDAPPPALAERLPPLPRDCGTVTWLPGRWQWTGIAGAEWEWRRGRYVAWPPGDRAPSVEPASPPRGDRVGIDAAP